MKITIKALLKRYLIAAILGLVLGAFLRYLDDEIFSGKISQATGYIVQETAYDIFWDDFETASEAELVFVGFSPDPEFILEVERIQSRIFDPRIKWDGVITVTSDMPLGGEIKIAMRSGDFSKGWYVSLIDLRIHSGLPRDLMLLIIEKELWGTAEVLSWWANHPEFMEYRHPDFLVLIDGLGNLTLADRWGGDFYVSSSLWISNAPPNCDQLIQINALSERGEIIAGGIPILLKEKGCN